ncbi:hypothetical protein PHMEG_00029301 [Phytophthora megakarya]|uniref:Retrotransposon gag domain-containing protein n=1 Tax=Phytophthora megakarya TaxID=4795 RepID=A0A225V1F4_9STRA|nr:hypothetical protein PHMEG_00029301 [Phytophthora megakarya]
MSRSWGTHSLGAQTSSAYRGTGREPQPYSQGAGPGRLPALPWSAPGDTPGAPTVDRSGGSSTAPPWNSSFESADASASRPGLGTFEFSAAGSYAPGYGVSFRPFTAYDAVEPFDTSLSLDKRRAWWDKFQYTASSGGWREQELCTRLYSQLSHNPGTKAWLSDRFYKEFCRSTESPVERYLRLKQEFRETSRTFLWRLNAAATKANVDFHSASGCRRHVNQFLKNLRDRELQLSLQGRVYFTTDELEDVLKQVEEMEQGMRRKPANDVQFGRHKPQGEGPGIATRGGRSLRGCSESEAPEPQVPDTEGLRWEDEVDSGYGYQYDEENDEAYDGLVDQEEVFRAEAPGLWNDRNGRSQSRNDPRGGGPPGAHRPSVPCPVCNKLGHTRERCWQLMKCDRCGGKHPTNQCRRRECEACCQLHPAGERAVIKAFKPRGDRRSLVHHRIQFSGYVMCKPMRNTEVQDVAEAYEELGRVQ